MLLTTYKQLKELDQPVSIYDQEGKVEDYYYLDSVIPPSVVVHYEHGNALQQTIDTPIICYYHDVEVAQTEVLWFLEKHSQSLSVA